MSTRVAHPNLPDRKAWTSRSVVSTNGPLWVPPQLKDSIIGSNHRMLEAELLKEGQAQECMLLLQRKALTA